MLCGLCLSGPAEHVSRRGVGGGRVVSHWRPHEKSRWILYIQSHGWMCGIV